MVTRFEVLRKLAYQTQDENPSIVGYRLLRFLLRGLSSNALDTSDRTRYPVSTLNELSQEEHNALIVAAQPLIEAYLVKSPEI